MALSEGDLEQLLSLVEDLSPGVDARSNPRIGLREQLVIRLAEEEFAPRMVQLTDLSKTGFGIICEIALQAGQKMLVELPTDNGKTLCTLAEVRHCISESEGVFRVGLKIIDSPGHHG